MVDVRPRMDAETSRRLEILARRMKNALRSKRKAPFNLDGPQAPFGDLKRKIDFGPAAGPVEMALCALWRDGQKIFDGETSQLAPTTG